MDASKVSSKAEGENARPWPTSWQGAGCKGRGADAKREAMGVGERRGESRSNFREIKFQGRAIIVRVLPLSAADLRGTEFNCVTTR
jgi:hypothetical protein